MLSSSLPGDRRTPLTYVALGDSTAFGLGASSPARHYVARLFDYIRVEYLAAQLINRGTCLASATDVLAHQLPDTIMDSPNLITLSVGPNDLRQGRSPAEFAARVEVILDRLDRATDAVVVVSQLPDMVCCPRFREPERSAVAALTRHYNHALQHVADGFNIELIDISIGDRTPEERSKFFSEDGYHPSDDGYAAWAMALWSGIRGKIPEPDVPTVGRLASLIA